MEYYFKQKRRVIYILPEEKYNLRIAFLGYDTAQTKYEFKRFIAANLDDIKEVSINNGYVIFNDGTIVNMICSHELIRGKRFDQWILCDDERFTIIDNRYSDIFNIIYSNTGMIPDEYREVKMIV